MQINSAGEVSLNSVNFLRMHVYFRHILHIQPDVCYKESNEVSDKSKTQTRGGNSSAGEAAERLLDIDSSVRSPRTQQFPDRRETPGPEGTNRQEVTPGSGRRSSVTPHR